MFKRITLFVIFVLCFVGVEAQLERGNKFLGGSIAFSHISSEVISNSSFNNEPATQTILSASPQIGFLLSEYIAIGAQISYRLEKSNQNFFSPFGGTFVSEIDQYLLGIAPFVKIYWKLAKRAGFTLNFSSGVGIGQQKSNSFSTFGTIKGDIFEANVIIAPQFYYFITPRIGVEASFGGLSYQYQQYRGDSGNFNSSETNQSYFSSTFGSGLALSFNYYFGKRLRKPKVEID